MKRETEVAYWEGRVADLERISAADPSPKTSEMLSDARNALRFVKTRRENMSKQKTGN